jgi:hypothetical protein
MQAKPNRTNRQKSQAATPAHSKAFHRSPYGEATKVIRCPVSLLPQISKLLEKRRAVNASAERG